MDTKDTHGSAEQPSNESDMSMCHARVVGGVNRVQVRDLSAGASVYFWAQLKGKVGTSAGEAIEGMWYSGSGKARQDRNWLMVHDT